MPVETIENGLRHPWAGIEVQNNLPPLTVVSHP
jgi:hypothetical protein